MTTLRAIDLCAGAGGWACAARGLPIEITDAWDTAPDCCATYRYNHPETELHLADIRQAQHEGEFRQHAGAVDLVLGSIPCEEISVARNSKKASSHILEEWTALLDAVLAAVQEIQPRYWCLENVTTMRRYLPPLTPYDVLSSADYSPQDRRRIFVGQFPGPAPGTDRRTLAAALQPGPHTVQAPTLDATITSRRQWYAPGTKRLLDPDRKSPTITDFSGRHSRGFVIRTPDGRERALSLTEAAALQGFPADYIFVAAAYRVGKMIGQAIQIDLGRAILRAIAADAETRQASTNISVDQKC